MRARGHDSGWWAPSKCDEIPAPLPGSSMTCESIPRIPLRSILGYSQRSLRERAQGRCDAAYCTVSTIVVVWLTAVIPLFDCALMVSL